MELQDKACVGLFATRAKVSRQMRLESLENSPADESPVNVQIEKFDSGTSNNANTAESTPASLTEASAAMLSLTAPIGSEN